MDKFRSWIEKKSVTRIVNKLGVTKSTVYRWKNGGRAPINDLAPVSAGDVAHGAHRRTIHLPDVICSTLTT